MIFLRIGLPRALIYYYYYPLWKTFFEELGAEVVLSDETSKGIINEGIKITVQEICVPIKIFNSHILNLLEKDVDYIFIPRMISIKKYETFCPKFLGLPDMSRNIFTEHADRFLSPKISCSSDKITNESSYLEIAEKLNVPTWRMKNALKKAGKQWTEFRKLCMKGFSIDEILEGKPARKETDVAESDKALNIGLIGYVYNVYDSFLSMDILSKIRNMGVKVSTFEMLSDKEIESGLKNVDRKLFWTFSNKLLGAGYHFLDDKKTDGLIHITAFGCGPDSFIGKMLELESEHRHKPFLTIRVDEHTGESHLITRIEAFVDMLSRRKQGHEGRVSV